jgi:hypothetical protein
MWTRARVTNWALLFGLALVLRLGLPQLGSAKSAGAQASKDVYVCACGGTKSCPCMGMANKEGKCACGADAPDMKPVPRDSAWAKANLKALSGK